MKPMNQNFSSHTQGVPGWMVPRTLNFACLLVLFLCLLLKFSHSCAGDERNEAAYQLWKSRENVTDQLFVNYLAEKRLSNVIPMHELMRSASDWKICKAPPFLLPPKTHWPQVASVLNLIKQLRAAGAIGNFEVHSAYRDPKLNHCAKGALSSAHTTNFALDITSDSTSTTATLVCRFWKTHGKKLKMGLSLYPSGRLHLDTKGYRTWGSTHKYASSYCQ